MKIINLFVGLAIISLTFSGCRKDVSITQPAVQPPYRYLHDVIAITSFYVNAADWKQTGSNSYQYTYLNAWVPQEVLSNGYVKVDYWNSGKWEAWPLNTSNNHYTYSLNTVTLEVANASPPSGTFQVTSVN